MKKPKAPANPLKGLSKEILDPKNFSKYMEMINAPLTSKCKHKNVDEFAKCKICSKNISDREAVKKKLGFKDSFQYLMWKRMHLQFLEVQRMMGFGETKKEVKKDAKRRTNRLPKSVGKS